MKTLEFAWCAWLAMQPWTASASLAWYRQNPTRHQTRAIADALARVVHAWIWHTILWRCWQKSCTWSKSQCCEVYKATKKRRLNPWRVSISNSPESPVSDIVWGWKWTCFRDVELPFFVCTRILLCKAGVILGFTTHLFENPGQSPNARSNWRLDTRSCVNLNMEQMADLARRYETSGQALGFGVLGCT